MSFEVAGRPVRFRFLSGCAPPFRECDSLGVSQTLGGQRSNGGACPCGRRRLYVVTASYAISCNMPSCIYCLETKDAEEFEPEHVLSRALCGTGANWTLTSEVCLDCNGVFSRFEAHWYRQAFEALARNFQGPVSRNDKDRFDRSQPVEIDGLYILMKDDPLIYEAGFSYPNEPHFRPQMIDTGRGLKTLVGRRDDIKRFKKGVDALLKADNVEITVPLWREARSDWLIAQVERKSDLSYAIVGWKRQHKPSGLWLRSFPLESFVEHCDRHDVRFTSRLALDHRGRVYVRSANVESAVRFLNLLFQPEATPTPQGPMNPGDQTVAFAFKLNLNHVYKGVLKTGFNLFCYLFGPAAALNPNFNRLRDILLRDAKDEQGQGLALRVCRIESGDNEDFPKASVAEQHRLQLDVTPEGILRFRMRLYNSFGYYAHLGLVPPELRGKIGTRRVVVDFLTGGMREVDTWKS